ncbi:hypothetical protein TWF694_004131 [Orbilia ellipsospora]|uniref:Uncharacterized protein n=1 Tax=Orbilia ellipsospora TaxID=2528407 RepID=A0AAV9X359_9PEZI
MSPKERLTAGNIFFAYQDRPEIATGGAVTGSTKDVVDMHWLNADDLAVKIDRDPDVSHNLPLAPFMAMSLHENHLIGLPLIKVPYTQTFNKTCERAERVDRTYLAVNPTENTVRLRSKRFDSRFRPIEVTEFPEQKICNDPKTGKPMPVWDTFIDLGLPIVIRNDKIEWYAEIFKAPVPEVIRLIRLYRFVQSLDFDIPDKEELDREGQPLDLDDRDRTQKRPVELIGPGVRKYKKEISPPSTSGFNAKSLGKAVSHSLKQEPANAPLKPLDSAHPNQASAQNKATWANVAGPGKPQRSIAPQPHNQNYNVNENHNYSPRGGHRGGQWNGRSGYNNGGRGKNRGRGGQYNENQGQRGNSGNRNSWNNKAAQPIHGQKTGPSGGDASKLPAHSSTQHPTNYQDTMPVMPPNGELAGLSKDTIVQAKFIENIEKEEPAPVQELLAVANAKALAAAKRVAEAKNAVDKVEISDPYNFAAYVRARENKATKLETPADERDSAEAIDDNDRTTWNKTEAELVKEKHPDDWYILKPGEVMIEGIKDIPTREGWIYQKPNTPWWVRVQNYLGLYGEDRKFKGWDYPDEVEY